MTLLEKLQKVQQADQLIRLKATGSPKELANKLGFSQRTLFDFIKTMKNMGAPIYYCPSRNSYCYDGEVKFNFGFMVNGKTQPIFGGSQKKFNLFSSLQFFRSHSPFICSINVEKSEFDFVGGC